MSPHLRDERVPGVYLRAVQQQRHAPQLRPHQGLVVGVVPDQPSQQGDQLVLEAEGGAGAHILVTLDAEIKTSAVKQSIGSTKGRAALRHYANQTAHPL